MKSILFRVDGARHLGVGHVSRCIAFAQYLERRQCNPVFVTRDFDRKIAELIQRYGYRVETIPKDSNYAEDASITLGVASRYDISLIVTDLGNTDNLADLDTFITFFEPLKAANKFLLAIDDLTKTDFPYDIQVIPYYGAERMDRNSNGNTKLLLGPAYFVFRQEFIEAAKVAREIRPQARNILLTIGGSDPSNLTARIASALTKLSLKNLRIVVGSAFEASIKQQTEEILQSYSGDYELIVDSDRLAELMLWSDLAITGGGLTKYEAAVTGTPSIIISHFDLEAQRVCDFENAGSTLHLGLMSEIDEDEIIEATQKLSEDHLLRAKMSESGRKLVDGKGIERIVSEIPRSLMS